MKSSPLCLILVSVIVIGNWTELVLANLCPSKSCQSSSNDSCAVPCSCRNPSLQPIEYFGPDTSPIFEHVMVDNNTTQLIDNVCITVFKLTDTVSLVLRSTVLKNGSLLIDKLIQGKVPGHSSIYREQGSQPICNSRGCSSCAYNYYVIGEVYPKAYVLYRCYFAGDCDGLFGNQERVGLSSYKDVTDCCKNQMIALANEQSDVFCKSEFIKLPYQRSCQCVAYFNGMPCINVANIRPEDAISLPDAEYLKNAN